MKRLMIMYGLIGIVLCLSGCSSYYYATLSSADRFDQRNTTRDFVQENDTVSVIYCFSGENAPVQITVHNKLDEPLYVDWARSGVVIDDVATGYDPKTVSIQGYMSSSSFQIGSQQSDGSFASSGSSSGYFEGEMSLPEGVTFIPPQSRVEHSPMDLATFSFDEIPGKAYKKGAFVKSDGGEVAVSMISYSEDNTPLRFRSFLTLYTDAEDRASRKRIYLERSFYLSRLVRTGNVPPSTFEETSRSDGDIFFVHKVKGAKTGFILGTIAVGVAGVAVQAAVGSPMY